MTCLLSEVRQSIGSAHDRVCRDIICLKLLYTYKSFRHLCFRDRSDLNWLLRPGLVESTCRVHVRSECTMTIGATQRVRFDPTQCACAHNMSNRLIALKTILTS